MNCLTQQMVSSMAASLFSYEQLESMMVHLDPTAPSFRATISSIRRSMDASCDGGAISIRQWRCLLETVSALQSEWTGRYNGEGAKTLGSASKVPGS